MVYTCGGGGGNGGGRLHAHYRFVKSLIYITICHRDIPVTVGGDKT